MTPIQRIIKGVRPLIPLADGLLVSRGRALYRCDPDFTRFDYLAYLPTSPLKKLLGRVRLFRRILRLDPARAIAIDTQQVLVYVGHDIWRLELATGMLTHEFTIPQSRKTLNITRCEAIPGIDDGFYFGEYWDSTDNESLSLAIWFRPLTDASWRRIYTFPAGEIDHVHDLVVDRHRACLWILTGDFGNASGIWQVRDHFNHVEPVLRGQQDYRAVWLCPQADALLYATDSNLEQNHFYRMTERGGQWEVAPLAELPGSSIYATMLPDGGVCFSTTVEPGKPSGNFFYDVFIENKLGPGIHDHYSRIYHYAPATGLREILRGKKDMFPMRLCQFGSFRFSHGRDGLVYAYGEAVKRYDDCLLVLAIATTPEAH